MLGDWQLPSCKAGVGRIAMGGRRPYAALTCGCNEERDGLGAATGLIDQEQTDYLRKEAMSINGLSVYRSQTETGNESLTAEAVMCQATA